MIENINNDSVTKINNKDKSNLFLLDVKLIDIFCVYNYITYTISISKFEYVFYLMEDDASANFCPHSWTYQVYNYINNLMWKKYFRVDTLYDAMSIEHGHLNAVNYSDFQWLSNFFKKKEYIYKYIIFTCYFIRIYLCIKKYCKILNK